MTHDFLTGWTEAAVRAGMWLFDESVQLSIPRLGKMTPSLI